MAEVKVTGKSNIYTAQDDVIEELKDGRQRLVARKGQQFTQAQAVDLGLVKQQSAPAPAETKDLVPGAETKGKAGDKTGAAKTDAK